MNTNQLTHNDTPKNTTGISLVLVLNDINNPSNIGGVFRLADAFAIKEIILSGNTILPPNTKINKASRSTVKYVQHKYVNNIYSEINKLKQDDYKIFSLEITKFSKDIRELNVNFDDKICLIIGSENFGIDDKLLELSQDVFHIPLLGENSSMNVTSATAIAIYQILKDAII